MSVFENMTLKYPFLKSLQVKLSLKWNNSKISYAKKKREGEREKKRWNEKKQRKKEIRFCFSISFSV